MSGLAALESVGGRVEKILCHLIPRTLLVLCIISSHHGGLPKRHLLLSGGKQGRVQRRRLCAVQQGVRVQRVVVLQPG